MSKVFYKLQYRFQILEETDNWRDSVVYTFFDSEEKARAQILGAAFPASNYRVVKVTSTEEVLD